MGSAKIINTNPSVMAETEKKSIKNILKKPFQALFLKDKRKEKKTETEIPEEINTQKFKTPITVTPVATLLENFKKLEIESKNEQEDEFSNFTIKIVDDVKSRNGSQTSQDSGFSEKDEKSDEIVESLKDLKIDDRKCEGKKKLQTVAVSRGPTRNKVSDYRPNVEPYLTGQLESETFQQISQVNQQTFSGGQVIINSSQNFNHDSEILRALNQVDIYVQNFQKNSQEERSENWQIVQEFLNQESPYKSQESIHQIQEFEEILTGVTSALEYQTTNIETQKPEDPSNLLSEFPEMYNMAFPIIDTYPKNVEESNPIEEFTNSNHFIDLPEELSIAKFDDVSLFMTPPRSENSPMSTSRSPFYPSNSDYSLSPDASSTIYNSDIEKYQELNQEELRNFHELPNVEELVDKEAKQRKLSGSSMTLKQYKNLQKEIESKFSKKDCCNTERKSCKELFEERLSNLKDEERRTLCVKVASMDLKSAYGVLQQILLSVSQGSAKDDIHYALFSLICERILSQKPTLFLGEFGLNLIKSAVLRCHRMPLFTRYLVQCVRTVLKSNPPKEGKAIFHEVDGLGDTLVTACARAGDAYALPLAEIVRKHDQQPPLFDLSHSNAEGYSALHVACIEHKPSSPRLHTVHVLLEHAAVDLWEGDVKGGDTPLHMAVNSANCDLNLIMLLFKHVHRKMWKQLAHVHNRSSVTPLEYARSATKSTTKQNYPPEVLEFLKKCR